MIRKLLRSVGTAFEGLAYTLGSEQNMRIHGVAAMCVIAAGIYFSLCAHEWIAVTLCIGLVISAECVNTAMERLADRVSLEKHPLIKHAKDCSSAAVLVMAMTAATVGLIVFVPKLRTSIGW